MRNDETKPTSESCSVQNRTGFGSPDALHPGAVNSVLRVSSSVLLVILALALVSCSTEQKQKWLTRFFDGVPSNSPKTNTAPVAEYDEDGRPLDKLPSSHPALPALPAPKFTAHPPYEDKKCSECHESRFSVKMKGPQTKVCFTCHDDFQSTRKFKHQPAENGECSSCHDPHGNSNPKMLLQTGQKLCEVCHDPFPKGAKSLHQPVESGECLSCHNPHASDSKGLLIKPGGKLCFECHDDFEKALAKAPFKHDPVGNGECTACHNPHQSSEKNLLIKSQSSLCLECHEQKDLARVPAHENQLQKACVDCHDPHAGANKFLLKPGTGSGGTK